MTNTTNTDRAANLLALAIAADERETLALRGARAATGARRAALAQQAAQAARDAASLRREAAALG